MRRLTGWLILVGAISAAATSESAVRGAENTIRVATYNTSLFRNEDGALVSDLEGGQNEQARKIAEVIQRVRPDVLFLNEFDYDADGKAAALFLEKYVGVGQNGLEPIKYAAHYTGPVNTGKPSGRDLDKDGKPGGPADAIGFGRHEGQYGMLVASRFPIASERVRSFQKFLWRDMPEALLPIDPKTGKPFFDADDLAVLRLSSKSHWDVPIQVPAVGDAKAFELHVLSSHPTPPVFDGPEDRNGKRNHDEIRLWADYIDPQKAGYLVDDAGNKGGLAADAKFVVVGDLNCDPVDGQSVPGTMDQLLKNSRVNASFTPKSAGGPVAFERNSEHNARHKGDPACVTSDFSGEGGANYRIDFVLPSAGLKVVDGGIFWPGADEPGGDAITATDHRMVWLDLRPE